MKHLRTLTASGLTASLALAALTLGLPSAAQAQYDNRSYDGYCYARKDKAQTNGAVIGAVVGGLAGSQVSKNERGLGTVGGAVLGGVVGSQIGKSSVKCYNGNYYAYQNGQYYNPPAAPDGYETIYFKSRPTSGYYTNVYNAPPSAYSPQPQAQEDNRYGAPYVDNSDYQSAPPQQGGQPYVQPQPYQRYSDNSSSTYTRPYADDTRYDPNSEYGSARPNNSEEGWRDDRGQWHDGRPRAVGWQDDQGNWHVGQVVTYGWRDRDGGWHEESSSYSSSTYTSGN